MRIISHFLLLSVFLTACVNVNDKTAAPGAPGPMAPGGTPPISSTPTNPATPGSPGTRPSPDAALSATSCDTFATTLIKAGRACGALVQPGAERALTQVCGRGRAKAERCGGNLASGDDCFRSYEPDDVQCVETLGGPDIVPVCNGDTAAVLGMYCLLALGNPACASGLRCSYDADCREGYKCNDAIGECFEADGNCLGLPCKYDADCPSAFKCNDAEGACIAR